MSCTLAARSRLRSVGVTLLTVGLLAAGSLATAASPASAATAPGDVSISDVQVTPTGVSAILTARTSGGAKIDPASVKATIGGSAAVVKVQPIVAERRVTTLLIDTSGSMGATGMATVVRAADSFLATAPADVYVGRVLHGAQGRRGPDAEPCHGPHSGRGIAVPGRDQPV
jgi:tight adherence protein B